MSANTIAITTHYAGHRFRSRLEARWAVTLDRLGIPWRYEPEGYELPSGRYLPDFWLPGFRSEAWGGTWLEIKGARPTERESQLARELAAATNADVLIAWGGVPRTDQLTFAGPDPDSGTDIEIAFREVGYDYGYAFCVCPQCGRIGVEFEARGNRICRHTTEDRGHTGDDPRILAAFRSAHSARFEHGERGGQ